jgi:hypothetical protein
MASISVAGWLARIGFVVLLAVGVWSGELGRRTTGVFLAIGLAAWILLPRFETGARILTPTLAILDIALVLAIFKRDVRIS